MTSMINYDIIYNKVCDLILLLMFSSKQLRDILTKSKTISAKDFDKLAKEAEEAGKNVEGYLINKRIISQDDLYKKAADHFKTPFIDLKDQNIDREILLKIPETIAINHNLIAFGSDGKKVNIAVLDPKDLETLEFIKKKIGRAINVHMTTPDQLKDALKKYQETIKSEIRHISGEDAEEQGGKDLKEIAEGLTIVKIVNDLIEYAIFQDASDIHIEVEEKDVVVRYRIDGVLRQVMTLNKNLHAGIIARIKILANLKVDEHRLPQDGRFKISNKRYNISFRVSIIPTFDGEKVVIRLLNEKAQMLSLDQLGFPTAELEIVKRNISKPNGMILVTGPTGSGKTTTLYTVLGMLNTPKVNISTIEDPIEYRMPHINQSQVNPKIGYTFAGGLRAFLRQDPDIIMVGEIRDQETAEIAVHAAMTGHLLLSTLHTNDTVTTLPRLSQMGIPSFLIASTTNMIISQRLARRVCSACKKEYKLDKKTVSEIKKQMPEIEKMLDKLVKAKKISSGSLDSMTFQKGEGCKKCNDTGYKGREGVYEVLEVTDEISKLILKNADVSDIKKQAEAQGMLSLAENGLIKAFKGSTTLEEVLRVTKE
ncbi:hypothetical protein GF382_03205 [Candidatus Falkowbacteria bacterium]|nr:hypothetical protein [Candidatus Falkowbacteria bacterium]